MAVLGAATTDDPRYVYPAHWIYSTRIGIRSTIRHWIAELFGRNLGNDHEPSTIFGGPSFTPPNLPNLPAFLANGLVNGISGWTVPTSLRQVGLSVEAHW